MRGCGNKVKRTNKQARHRAHVTSISSHKKTNREITLYANAHVVVKFSRVRVDISVDHSQDYCSWQLSVKLGRIGQLRPCSECQCIHVRLFTRVRQSIPTSRPFEAPFPRRNKTKTGCHSLAFVWHCQCPSLRRHSMTSIEP